MPTPAERQALLFFAAVAALGVGVNAWRAVRGGDRVLAGSPAELAAQIARVDSAVASSPSRDSGRAALKRRNAKKKRAEAPPSVRPPAPPPRALPPLASYGAGPPGQVDLDRAGVAAIESLPRIGPALAARIVANRDSFGPFGSMDGLQRVRGIGPAMVRALGERAVFSGVPREGAPTAEGKGRRRVAVP
ncbi:MAG: helix-hairpin-helix domain-containing protein [Gemmatimonadota bacterium]|nr:helix-hairpin-helix domain-containing protein [Gemmatimonadota bacterium]